MADAGHGAPGQGVSASRVVREPGRWSRLVVVLVVVGLVAGGLSWWVGDSGPEDGRSSGSARDTRPTRVAFNDAVHRLAGNSSFAYEGEVHAAEQSSFRPGDWTARDVTVEGAVLLDHRLTRDVAVDATGRAVETVTSGPTVWTRSASTVDGLGDEPWEFRSAPGPPSLGTAAVANLILSATDPWEAARDATGRRLIHATLPPRRPSGRLWRSARRRQVVAHARPGRRHRPHRRPIGARRSRPRSRTRPHATGRTPSDRTSPPGRCWPAPHGSRRRAGGVGGAPSRARRRPGGMDAHRRVGDPGTGGSRRVPASLSVVPRIPTPCPTVS